MSLSRRQVLERLHGLPVLVVGDVMLDEYLFGDVQRISPDAPVPVVALQQRRFQLGGAANVANNAAALSARPILVGATGKDEDGRKLVELLQARGIEHRLVVVDGRPTTRKTRVMSRNQHLIRLDQETCVPLDAAARREVLDRALSGERPALVVLSDYGKGVVGRELAEAVLAWAQEQGIPAVVDPKSADFTVYRGAAFVTPNTKEAQAASRVPVGSRDEVIAAGRRLLAETGGKGMLVTRGELGMALITEREAHFVAAHKRNVFDVTGAGDTVITMFGLCIAAGAEGAEAMALANWAAGIVVGRLGAATCTREEVAREAGIDWLQGGGPEGEDERIATPRLQELPEAVKTLERFRAEGRRIVFTNGCFDILHAGHVVLLEEARARGDALVVGLNSDASIKRLKGPARPVQTLRDRARVLAALHSVDLIVSFEEDTPLELVKALRPDVLVKGGDYQPETIVGAREVTGWGGEVVVVPLLAARSTSNLLKKQS